MNKLISIDDLTIDQINDIVKIAKIYKVIKLLNYKVTKLCCYVTGVLSKLLYLNVLLVVRCIS